MQIIFLSGTKCLLLPQYVNKFLAWHKKFGPAQNILGPVKGQGNSVRCLGNSRLIEAWYFVLLGLFSFKMFQTPHLKKTRTPLLNSEILFMFQVFPKMGLKI